MVAILRRGRGAGVALAVVLGGLVGLSAPPAGATYADDQGSSIVYSSTYVVPCAGGAACRQFSAPHPGGSPNLWVVNPGRISATGTMASDASATRQLTDTTGNDHHPSWSPDGAFVTFDRDTTNNPQIWQVTAGNQPSAEDADPSTVAGGTAPDGAKRLTDDESSDTNPSYAPDGHTIAFVQDSTSVVTIDALASAPTESVLVSPTTAVADERPVYDPVDQTKLMFVDGRHHLMLLTGAGGPSARTFDVSLASGLTIGADDRPDWSPDGSTIVFDSTRPLPGGTHTITQQLWTLAFTLTGNTLAASASPVYVNASGVPAVSGFKDIEPVWSPDGKALAWTRTLGNQDVNSLQLTLGNGFHLTVGATATDLTLASTNPTDTEPNWSGGPDNQGVVITVPPGALTISTPYTPTNPFGLGTAQLTSNGTELLASGMFGSPTNPTAGITITDTRSGDPAWTASLIASDFTSGAQTISSTYLGFTGVHATYVPGNALNPSTKPVITNDVPAPTLGSPATPAAPGLAGAAHTFATAAHGDGTVYLYGTLGLAIPTSAQAGTYTATITFTAA